MSKPNRYATALHVGVAVLILGAVSIACGRPLVIPAVGASAALVFGLPLASTSAPRNVLVGHLVGALIGWAMLWVFGLLDTPVSAATALTWTRIGATAASLAATALALDVLGCAHPPAGATTMIVALAASPPFGHVFDFELGALCVVAYAWIVHRSAGVGYPLWAARATGSR